MASHHRSISANGALVVLEPGTRALVAAVAKRPFVFQVGPVEGRLLLAQAQAGAVPKPVVTIEDTSVQGGLVGEISIRIIRPRRAVGALPAIVYFHGGGWVLGDHDTHDRLTRQLAVGTRAAVVFANCSRAPEERYPTAIEESYAVLRHVAETCAP